MNRSVRAFRVADVFPVLFLNVRVEAFLHAGDQAVFHHRFAVLHATKHRGVQPFLLVDHPTHAPFQRLDQHDVAIEIGFLVEIVELPINERAEEVAFPELEDTHRSVYRLLDIKNAFHFADSFV
jgi:hypothetical protein